MTARASLLLTTILWAPALCAQAPEPAPDAGAPLPDGAPEAMAHVDREGLREHAEYLASDELGGRYTASTGQEKAAEYVAARLEELGLAPLGDRRSWFQRWPIERTELDPKGTSLEFGDEEFATGFAVVPSSDKDRLRLSGKFVYCGDGSPDQIPGGLRGKIPVVWLEVPGAGAPGGFMASQRPMTRAASVARQVESDGGRAVLFCILDDDSPVADWFNYGALLPDKPMLEFGSKAGRRIPDFRIPAMFLCSSVSKKLFEHIGIQLDGDGAPGREAVPSDERGKLSLRVRMDARAHARNVVGVLEGTDLDHEAIVYSAHMDHMGTRFDGDAFNGADDNASGTAGLLEIAEAFAKGEKPRRSVVFLAVSGEELGLWGSEYYADNPTWPASKIVANINIDMIGRRTTLSGEDEVSVTPSHEHSEYSTIVESAAALARAMGMGLTNGDTYYQRSDHYNFIKKGIPAVFFCDGEHADYHKVTDHADKLDYAKAEKVARLAFWTGLELANSAQRPRKLGSQSDW